MPSWVVAHPSDLAISAWSDGSVVFDEVTNQLHFFEHGVAEVLEFLSSRPPFTQTSLAQDFLSSPPSEEEIVFFNDLLLQFESLGIVKRLTSYTCEH